MKNNKFRVLLVFALILSLAISAPISVSAKTKKVGKAYVGVSTYGNANEDEYSRDKTWCYGEASNAKKIVVYKSSTKTGKYKKVLTLNADDGQYIKRTKGLAFYKARGINGKKKGKYSSPVATYGVDISLVSVEQNMQEETVTAKFFVDNSKSKNSITFKSKDEPYFDTSIRKDKSDIHYAYMEDGEYYDEDGDEVSRNSSAYAYGEYTDELGNPISSKTIKAKESGYLYLKYTYDFDEDAEKAKDLNYSKRAIEKALNKSKDVTYYVEFDMNFYTKSKGKTYKFFTEYDIDNYVDEYATPEDDGSYFDVYARTAAN